MTEGLDPGLLGTGPGRSHEAVCLHCQRSVLISNDRSAVRQAVVLHLVRVHGRDGLVLEGEDGDFIMRLALPRCDLCMNLAERPWWTYTTPARPPVFQVEDPEWLVCDTCHELISSHDKPLRVLLERALREQRANMAVEVLTEQQLRDHLKPVLRQFLTYRQGEPRRSSL